MDVRHYPFVVTPSPRVGLQPLWNELTGLSRETITYKGRQRRIYFVRGQEWHMGLILTMRQNKTFVEAKTDQIGNLELNVGEVTAGNAMYDFNHFVVHNQTGRGIYQHYPHASHLSAARQVINRAHNQVLTANRNTEIQKVPASKHKAIRAEYSVPNNRLTMTLLATQQKFTELFGKLKEIRYFQFEIASLELEREEFRPLGKYVRAVEHKFKFTRQTKQGQIKDAVLSAVSMGDLKKKKVVGIDQEGATLPIDFEENYLSIHNVHFDELVKGLARSSAHFHLSQIIQDLVKLAEGDESLALKLAS